MNFDDRDDATYYLMYADEDLKKLKVLKLYASDSHEIHRYAIASRQSWSNPTEATTYGMQLAKDNGLEFEHDKSVDPESYRESLLLD